MVSGGLLHRVTAGFSRAVACLADAAVLALRAEMTPLLRRYQLPLLRRLAARVQGVERMPVAGVRRRGLSTFSGDGQLAR